MKKLLSLTFLLLSMNTFANVNKEPIRTTNAPAPLGTYSQAIKSNNIIYISGQIGIVPGTGELINGNFDEQVNQVFKNIKAITDASWQSIDNIVKLNVYMPDLSNFSKVNESMKLYFKQPYPARSVVEVKALPKNAAIEIEAIVAVTK